MQTAGRLSLAYTAVNCSLLQRKHLTAVYHSDPHCSSLQFTAKLQFNAVNCSEVVSAIYLSKLQLTANFVFNCS